MASRKDHLFSVNSFLVVIYCVILLSASIYAAKKAEYNWDILPYMGVILSYDHADAKTIHEHVYNTAKKEVPPVLYERLTDPSNKYRNSVTENPEVFYAQLPFYVVKPMYTRMAWLFYKAGASLTMATVLPSVISYFFIGLLLFYWLNKYRSVAFSFVAGLLIMFSSPLLSVAKISTPDALSGLLLFAAMFFIVERRSFVWAFIFLLLALFARLDNIIPAIFIVSCIVFSHKRKEKISIVKYLVMMLGILTSYFMISFNARSFGWSLFFYPNFAKQLNSSYSINNSFALNDYIALAKSQFMTGLFFSVLGLFFLLVLFLVWEQPLLNFRRLNVEQVLAIVFVLIIITRFILQPLIADRLYIPYYLSVIVFLVKKYSFATADLNAYKR